jgi:transposase
VHDIEQLKRAGLSVSAISAMTGYDRKTVRKYLDTRQAVPVYGPRSPRPGKLDPFRDYIEERLSAGAWNAVVLLRELKQRGYCGGYSILKEYLQPKRQAAQEVAVRRFETPPGHQAQVDWGELGTVEFPDAERQRLYGFVFTLGHSRAMFAEVALDQRLGTLLAMHEAAFSALGGVPHEVLYDRMKTVATGGDDRGEIEWQPLFLDFARYWGFAPRLCRAYRPQTKGKVESGIKYVRRNFLCGRTATSVADLREQLRTWNLEVAFPRVHGTTHRVVREAWREEVSHLQSCAGRAPFPHAPAIVRRVSRDAYVSFQTNRYPVPWEAAGRQVALRVVGEQLEIRAGGVLLAAHALCSGQHQVLTLPGHYAGLLAGATAGPGGKARITISVAAPEVEVRPLSAYEALAGPVTCGAAGGGA